ncbi:MAG: YerC/YecD family TrpR-related protein [Thermaerobacter sp.]|nr:YerC/YecD family TrpR-related protein [Thermaerobacter sp.]
MDHETEFLLEALTAIASSEEAHHLLEDLLTPREIEELSLRMDIARRLHQGQTYEVIQQETGASSTTISRVRRALMRGAGGYRAVLGRLLPEA